MLMILFPSILNQAALKLSVSASFIFLMVRTVILVTSSPDAIPVEGSFNLFEMKVIPVPVEHGKVECIGYVFCRDNSPLLGYVPDCKKFIRMG